METEKPLKQPPGYRASANQMPPGPRRIPAAPPSYYRPTKKHGRGFCCRCCCCLFCTLFLIILILAVAGAIFYLWFQPKSPIFRFRPIEIDRFNIAKRPGAENPRIDSNIVVRVEVRNPNSKLRIYYGDTTVSLTADGDTELGAAKVAAFRQAARNVTMLKFEVKAEDKEVDDTVATALAARMKNKAVVLSAAVKTKVGIGAAKLKIGMLPVVVNCGGISLKQLNDTNSAPKCSFTTLRWITIR